MTYLFLTMIFLALTGLVYRSYRAALAQRSRERKARGHLAQTALGPVEYALLGDSGPVVMFLHGAPIGYDQAVSVAPGFRTLAPSRPGFYGTPLELGKTPSEQARVFAALLDHLGIDRVVVYAASAGGPSGLAFAALYPERTIAVIASEAVSGPTKLPYLPPLLDRDFPSYVIGIALWRLLGRRGLVRLSIPAAANRERMHADPAKVDEMVRLFGLVWPMSVRKAGSNNDTDQFIALELPLEEIVAPTLVIHGTDDINVPLENGERTAARVPGARIRTFEGADHFLPWTHKGEYDAVVTEFLRSITLP